MPSSDLPVLLLVTGSGRSGTSSLAGSLKMLGWHVPQPEVAAAGRNVKGHFEPRWAIRFHKRNLRRVDVLGSDARPHSLDLIAPILEDGAVLDTLTEWLAGMPEPRVVVKDPHATMFLSTWRAAAERAGRDLRVLTAIRHPAEVVGSRDLAWGQGRDDRERRASETTNVAQWLNQALLTDLGTRGLPRAVIRYTDLVADWRAAIGRVSAQLDLGLDLSEGRDHPLDTWLEAGLRHSELGWEDLSVAAPLSGLADDAWQQLNLMVDDPDAEPVSARLDVLRSDYARLFADSLALVRDEVRARVNVKDAKLQRRRRQVRALRDELAAQRPGRHGFVGRLRRR